MVNQDAKLMVPVRVLSKLMNIVDQQRHGSSQSILPFSFQTIHRSSIRCGEVHNMTLASPNQCLSGGMEQVRTSGLGFCDQKQRIETATRKVDDMFTKLRCFEVFFCHEPLLERRRGRPVHALWPLGSLVDDAGRMMNMVGGERC